MSAEHVSSGNAKYTWSEVSRAEPPTRAAGERVADFLEIYGPYDEGTAREQASRCIQCPSPACVTGCPLDSRIPQWLALTADGQFLEAAELMLADGMPEIHARVCVGERNCEAACLLGAKSEPVPISSIGHFLLDYAWKHGVTDTPVALPKGQRVAVIGSGLCGLVGADELSRLGYRVAVIDSHAKPGGRLVNGLPGFRINRSLVERRVELLKQRGVELRLGIAWGSDVTLASLQREFDAVFFGWGRAEIVPLEIPGAALQGVHQAYPFVLQHTAGLDFKAPPVDVHGRRVAVLGGGDTAMDTARIAVRLGASKVVCIYRRDAARMPASPREFEHAQEEGVQFLFLSNPVEIVGHAAGQVTHVRCLRVALESPDDVGRGRAQPVAGSEFDVPADRVLVAYGFAPPRLPATGGFEGLRTDERGCLVVDADQMTTIPGVFAGGSIVRGPIPLVDAVRDARKAAAGIDRYLAAHTPMRNH
jgi:glutamate synthase (NADPH/NADH) small chain